MSRGQDVVSLTPPSSGGPLRIVADGLLFFLILTGLLFSVCSVYGLEPDGAALLGVCVLLSALTLLVYSLPRRRWVAMLLLACLYAWLSWRYQDALVAGACVAADRVLSVLDISLQVSLVWMTGGSGELLWFLAMAAALLCVPLGWAVIRGRSAVLTLVLTLPWLLPAMLVELLPDWLPLMALAAGWCVLLLSGLCGREDAAGGARFSLICLPAVAALLLAISLLLPQGQYNRPAWTDSARAALANTALEFLGSGGPLSSVASLMTGGDQVSVRLDDAGPRTFQDRVVLEVESDYTGRLYLRGTSAGVYTGEAWEPLSDVAYAAIGLSESASVSGRRISTSSPRRCRSRRCVACPGTPPRRRRATAASSTTSTWNCPTALRRRSVPGSSAWQRRAWRWTAFCAPPPNLTGTRRTGTSSRGHR